MTYRHSIRIEFNHCDPAGIVFYPRFFEMTNSLLENFFRDELKHPYDRVIVQEGYAIPTAKILANFEKPCWLGEIIEFSLEVHRIGTSSADFWIVARRDDEVRLTVEMTMVWVGQDKRPQPWPTAIRAGLATHMSQHEEQIA